MAFCPLTCQSCYNTDVFRCLRLLDSSNYPRTSDSNYPHTSDWFFWWTLTGSQSFWIEHHQWFYSGVVCVGVSVFCKIFFFELWVCKSNCFLFFIFFYLTCVLGCDGLGWIFGFFLVSYALGFLSSTRYVFEWWFCKSNFFFLTYVLGCDGLVWILAPRDIDNV